MNWIWLTLLYKDHVIPKSFSNFSSLGSMKHQFYPLESTLFPCGCSRKYFPQKSWYKYMMISCKMMAYSPSKVTHIRWKTSSLIYAAATHLTLKKRQQKVVGFHLFCRKKTSTSPKNHLGPSFFEGFASVFRAVLGSPVPTSDLRSGSNLKTGSKFIGKKPTVGYVPWNSKAPENWWLEDYFLFGRACFQVLCLFWGV